ncbi:hypothetical protein ACOSQ3_033429 [Xanthoceras sorbifolium]
MTRIYNFNNISLTCVKVVIPRAALPPSWRRTFVRSSLVFPYPSSALIGKKRFGQLRILGLPSQQFLSIFLLGGLRSVLFWDVIELLVSAPIGSILRHFRAVGCDQFLSSSFFSDPLTVRDWCCWCARIHCGAVLLGGFLARSVSSPIVRLVCRFFFGSVRILLMLVAWACSLLGTGAVFGGVGCCAVIVALPSNVIFV